MGHLLPKKRSEIDQEIVAAVKEMKSPSNLKELSAVLAPIGVFRKFIPELGKNSEPLYILLKKTTL